VSESASNVRAPRSKARLEAFSDGVFAIAITLLVLEIGVPEGSGGDLLGAILDQWPSYLAYFVSFITVAAYWIEHDAITQALDHADGIFVRLNLLFLAFVSFVPFPTKLVAEYLKDAEPERVAVSFYGLILLAMSLLMTAMYAYASNAQLLRPGAEEDNVMRRRQRDLYPSIVSYLVVLGVALIAPIVAVLLCLVVAAYIVLPWHYLLRDRST
jgi:uncharacterized membrane protein